MRINGWHRLWVLVSLLALLAAAAGVVAMWPTEASIQHSISFYDALSPNARAQIAESESEAKEGVQMPNGHVIYLKPEIAASRKTEALLQYQDAVLKALEVKKQVLLVRAAVVWLALSLIVLAVGHAVAWVIRGFRGSNQRPRSDSAA